MKTKIKELAGQVLLRTGLWQRALRRWARSGEGIILTYHRVIEKWDRTLDYSQPGMVVTADTFDRQLTFLKQHFTIVPLSDFVNPKFEIPPSAVALLRPSSAVALLRRMERTGRNPKSPSLVNSKFEIRNSKLAHPMCALTFDDGWRDNYEIAFPILRKHEVPATIFLTTDFIGTSRAFWHTRLMYVLLHGDLSNGMQIARVLQAYPPVVRQRLMGLVPMTEAPSAQDVDHIIEAVKGTCDEETIEELIRDLAHTCGVRRPLLADRGFFLDWDQVCDMASGGIEIGSHGCSHRILTRLKADQAEDELIRSKAEIEQRIGGKVRHFAFPDGAANRSLMESAGRAGYESASLLATAPDEGNTGMLALRRVGMHEGASMGNKGSFSETSLLQWLLRAPRTRSGLPQP